MYDLNKKRKNRRRIAAVFLAAFCLLAGCSAGPDESGSNVPGTGASEASRVSEKKVLTYMVPGYGDDGYLGRRVVERINETFPDIEIQLEKYAEDQYYTVLNTRLATGKGPDLFFIQPEYAGANGLNSLVEAGYLAPVTDLTCIRNADETQYSLLRRGDQVYSVSVGKMAVGLLYNKTLFDENGLAFPGCWEDFLACCKDLKEKGIRPLTLGAMEKNGYQLGLYQIAVNQLYAQNADYDKELREGTRKFTDQDGWNKVLRMYMDLYDRQYMDQQSIYLTARDTEEMLLDREVAMIFTGSMQAGGFLDGARAGSDEFLFTTLPANERGGATYWSMGEIGGIGMYAGTKYPEACRAVLEEMWSYLLESDGPESGDFFGEAREAYESGRYFHLCNHGWYNEVEVVMEKKLQEYFSGSKIQIEDITLAMQRELER